MEDRPVKEATAYRIRIARRLAEGLAEHSHVRAIIATGSVAHGRCSADSDLDLAILTTAPGARRRIESEERDGVVVDLDWIPWSEALRIVTNDRGDIKTLREASRLGQGLAIHDPHGSVDVLRRHADSLKPDSEAVRDHLKDIFLTLIALSERRDPGADFRWDLLRAVYDSCAFLLLLLHPIRYQKPKWVIDDLCRARYGDVAEGLLRAYGAQDASSALARGDVDAAKAFVEAVASVFSLPGYRETIDLGFTRSHAEWSYVCRSLGDAESLLHDESLRAARYTARMSVRLAVGHAAGPAKAAPCSQGLYGVLQAMGPDRLTDAYKALFRIGERPEPTSSDVAAGLETAKMCKDRYERQYLHEFPSSTVDR